MSYIKGNYTRTIFESNTGYLVGLFKVLETDDELDYTGKTITFTGYFHELNNIDTYIFYGKVVHHDKYGEQFQVDHYERSKPVEKDAIIEFLTSGLFKGIGEKKAKAIVDVLGKDTLKTILESPNNLILIPGISQSNINVLHSKLKEYEESYEVILYLTDMGFSTKDSMVLYHKYKKQTRKIIEDNIYQIIDEIPDFYFKKIDMIALRNGVLKDDFIRVQAATLYVMSEVSNTYGHCYYSYDEILLLLPRVLGCEITEERFKEVLLSLEKDMKIVIREDRYYLSDMYEAETFIVKRFRYLSRKKEKDALLVDESLHQLEEFLGIQYNPTQLEAIEKSYCKDFLIITGGPGTGKTTILKGILELYRMMRHYSFTDLLDKVALLAPTGRAAKRMSEATNFKASTIHRFLKWQKETNRFQVNEYHKSNVEFIIVYEASMIDTLLMSNLLKGVSSNCKIVLVGDDHQLPSVGPGQVLRDVIQCNMLPVVELTELYRQGKDSNIISLAYDIRRLELGKDLFNQEDDLTFIDCKDSEIGSKIGELCETYRDLSYHDFQILVPMYKGLNGIDEINKSVQAIYNPIRKDVDSIKVGDVIFQEGDKVIQLTNMPDDNVYNGDIGVIDQISPSNKEIYIDFDGNVVKYTPSSFHQFRLAYAISIHKSQGSEFEVVVIPMVKGYHKMLYQRLIYTAVTRAKKKLYIIGDWKALEMACYNNNEDSRRTTIQDYFISGIK